MGKYGSSIGLREILNAGSNEQLAIGTPDPTPGRKQTKGTILLPYSTRAAHMHAIGVTRSGKSRFLADLICQDILNGFGVCVIDPHAELVNLTVDWLMQNKYVVNLNPNIHVVRLADIGTTFKYNPLAIEDSDEAYSVASNVSGAITRMFGGNHPSETPRFWFVVDVICTILALQRLPFAAAKYLFKGDGYSRDLRERICDGVHDPYFRALGLEMAKMTAKEFREKVESTLHRLHQIFRNPAIERMFSSSENTANFRQMMDERHVLLLDTSDESKKVTFAETRLIGMLFVNNIFADSRGRATLDRPAPFYTYIDEAQNYLSNDIEDILSQASKRGLYLTLSHQHLGQLIAAGEVIYKGVMAGARLKAVFQTTAEDADALADELFANEIDFQRVKEKLKTPHVVGHEITELKGLSNGRSNAVMQSRTRATASSESYGESESEGYSSGSSTSDTEGAANTMISVNSKSMYVPDDPGLNALGVTLGTSKGGSDTTSRSSGTTENEGYSRTTTQTSNYSNTTSEAKSEGSSTSLSDGTSIAETLKPVIEWFSTTAYSLEEQRYDLKRRLAFQDDRHGYLAVRRKGTIGFTTRYVADPLNVPDVKEAFLAQLRKASPWVVPSSEVPLVLDQPKIKALLTASKKATPEPDDYFESDEHPPFEEEEAPRPARSAKSAPKIPPPRGSRKS